MKRVLLLFLSLLMIMPASASDFEITDDYTVKVDKDALLAALFEADIPSLRQAIDLKLISCQELTEYYLERIETYNDTFECFITLCDDAVEVAKRRDRTLAVGRAKGSLFGIPVVVKDNIDYEGHPTTNGLVHSKTDVADESATIVQRLLDEGAVIIGKTNMSAAAQDALFSISGTGLETHNAYNPALSSGGSSGGSAAAVSLNFAVAGLGTDTNVSLRYPSALNGCVSLRPTTGLLEKDGCVLLNTSRDTAGAITKNVIDQAIMLDAMTDGSYEKNLNANVLDGMRIGVLSEFSYPLQESGYRSDKMLDDEIQAAFDQAVSELSDCGAQVITVSWPSVFNDVANATSPAEKLYTKLVEFMRENKISALIYPTYCHTPHKSSKEYKGEENVYNLSYICNCATFSPLTGSPEITVPIGQHSSGAGIGMEILATKNQEQLLLNIAYSYTQRYDHRASSEVAPNLYSGEMELTLSAYLHLYQQALDAAEAKKNEATELPTEEPTTETQEVTAPAPEVPEAPVEEAPSSPWFWLIPLLLIAFVATIVYFVRKKRFVFR